MEVVSRVLLLAILLLPSISPLVECALTAGPRDSYNDRGEDTTLDYDVHVPISAIPLGINVGASLEILSFREDVRTGDLPWIARRGWLVVGDKLVALEGRDVSQARCVERHSKGHLSMDLLRCTIGRITRYCLVVKIAGKDNPDYYRKPFYYCRPRIIFKQRGHVLGMIFYTKVSLSLIPAFP